MVLSSAALWKVALSCRVLRSRWLSCVVRGWGVRGWSVRGWGERGGAD
ncbi:hypothetical protein [Nocardia sp. NPDC050412]